MYSFIQASKLLFGFTLSSQLMETWRLYICIPGSIGAGALVLSIFKKSP